MRTDVVSEYMLVTSTGTHRFDRLPLLHFSAGIDRNSTTFNYNGTSVTVTADQLELLQEIGSGGHGKVSLLEIDEPVQMSMAVKVTRLSTCIDTSRRAKVEAGKWKSCAFLFSAF